MSQLQDGQWRRCARKLSATYPLPAEGDDTAIGTVDLLIIDFYRVGSHENFYDELKRYLKSGR